MCIRRTLKEFKLECPACRAPAKEEDLRPNHALEAVVGAYKAARTRLLAGARRVDDPMPKAVAAPPGREGTTKRNKRGGANNDRAPAPDDAPPAKRATRRTSRNTDAAKSNAPTAETQKATRSSARATGGAEASTSGGGAWGRPIRASRRAAAPTPPSEDDTADEEDEDDKGEAGDADYGGTQGGDEGDDVVSESDLETDAAARDDVVDLVDDEDGSGGGGKSRRKLGSRQPSAPSTTPRGSDDKKRPGTVQCPICGVGVQEGLINSHVDVCLTRGGAFGSAIAEAVGGESSPKDEFGNENSDEQYAMAKLPKLVYHIMKDKPLRKLLSDAGLSAVGRRDQLIDRHKEFTLRVNASIDSGHRPNLAAIAKEVSKLERDRDRAGMMPAPGLMGSGGSGLAAAAAPASKADVFGKLISDVRARGGAGAKARRDSSPVEDSEDDGDERELQGHADTLGDEGDVRVQEEATEGGVEVEVR